MTVDAIPDRVRDNFDGNFIDDVGTNVVLVTLGIFSVVRVERPVQLLIPACHYCIPEKDSTPCESGDPVQRVRQDALPVERVLPRSGKPRCQRAR